MESGATCNRGSMDDPRTASPAPELSRAVASRSMHRVSSSPKVLAMVQQSPISEVLGRERMHFNLEKAVKAFQERGAALAVDLSVREATVGAR